MVKTNTSEEELQPKEELQLTADLTDQLIHEFEEHPDEEVREKVFQLLNAVDRLHRPGLVALMQFLESKKLWGIIEQAHSEPAIRTLLELYDLLPQTEQQQVEKALDLVRPYMQSHGGEIDVLGVTDGVVRVRLAGSCHGCSGSAVTLRRGVEEALKADFSGFRGMEVEDSAPQPAARPSLGQDMELIPLEAIATPARPVFQYALLLDELPPGQMKGVVLEGVGVLLCNLEGEIYALHNACHDTGLAITMGELRGEMILCPWHGCKYDARSGKALTGEGDLALYPVAVADGVIRVAVNTPHKGGIVGVAPKKQAD